MKVPKPNIRRRILHKNKYNRLGLENSRIKRIVWYKRQYSYEDLWAFFNGIPYNKVGNKKFYLNETAHFIIKEDGTIVQCLPLDESCVYDSRLIKDSINIVLSGDDISEEQYLSMVNLGSWICQEFKLDPRKDNVMMKSMWNKEQWIKFKRIQHYNIKEFKNKF
ncbi:MAG: N-acetylmuramoyl-L-alanine amidase [Intestinibacter sp.]